MFTAVQYIFLSNRVWKSKIKAWKRGWGVGHCTSVQVVEVEEVEEGGEEEEEEEGTHTSRVSYRRPPKPRSSETGIEGKDGIRCQLHMVKASPPAIGCSRDRCVRLLPRLLQGVGRCTGLQQRGHVHGFEKRRHVHRGGGDGIAVGGGAIQLLFLVDNDVCPQLGGELGEGKVPEGGLVGGGGGGGYCKWWGENVTENAMRMTLELDGIMLHTLHTHTYSLCLSVSLCVSLSLLLGLFEQLVLL